MGPEVDRVAGVCGEGGGGEALGYADLDYGSDVGRLVLASRVLNSTNCVEM
jgi:hypothetical protein